MRKAKTNKLFQGVRWRGLLAVAVLGVALISGCGGSSASGPGTQSGVFVDSAVSGLSYKTWLCSGETDANGTFKYVVGETVTFSIGNLVLGSKAGAATLTPIDLVSGASGVTDQRVTNICVLLQTLDENGDLNNGIKINDKTAAIVSANASDINFDQTPMAFAADAKVTALLAALNLNNAAGFTSNEANGRTLRSAAEAQGHLQASISPITTPDARAIAKDAYIFAFPMLEFYRVGYSVLNRAFSGFTHARVLRTSADTSVVAPNNDTLYSSAWLNLTAEPYVLEVPAITDRYYSFQLIDQYTHVPAIIGTRTTGTGPGKYLIAGPNWKEIPVSGITKIFRVESNLIFILARTAVNGTTDLDAVHAVQDTYKLNALSTFMGIAKPSASALSFPVVDLVYPSNFSISLWNLPGIPPLNTSLPDSPPYKEMSAAFIGYFNFLLGRVSPVASEASLLGRFSKIGIGPDLPFDAPSLTPEIRYAINAGISDAKAEINNVVNNYTIKNGWNSPLDLFGSRAQMEGRYTTRAYAALNGLFGLPAEETIYPGSTVDSTGQVYNGSNKYVLTFPAGKLPPLKDNGFWSLTMYNANRCLVDNALNRYSIGSLKGYTLNPDGSLSIYLQSDPPAPEKLSNWLPAPKGGQFSITLRLYLPDVSAVNGSWWAPAVVKVD